jgi:hypothetical protein
MIAVMLWGYRNNLNFFVACLLCIVFVFTTFAVTIKVVEYNNSMFSIYLPIAQKMIDSFQFIA